jgi:uncharacterized heparinase superfamily protein
MIARAGRLFRTVRYLGAGQITTRATRIAERLVWRMTRAKAPVAEPLPLRSHDPLWREIDVDEHALANARAIVAGRFTFLNVTRVQPSWNEPGVVQLWSFMLHYFDYVRDLLVLAKAGDREAAYGTFRTLAQSWIAENRALGGNAWHPYTISLRVVNWCEASCFFSKELARDSDFAHALHGSITAQTRFLAKHLETDVRGNHLLENTRALLRAAAFFEGREPEQWRKIAQKVLERELPEQILADGGHFERSPGYHVRVMDALSDIAQLQPPTANRQPPTEAFLHAILPSNGRLPLFKDTTLPHAPLPAPPPQPSRWLAASGYAVMRDDARGDHLIADFGNVCPDYLPAHAHADMFSFELTIGGEPVIVDSGVYEYAAGEWRRWFRSTAAHNTVEIDGRDQSEMWGSFRVGRRARPRHVVWQDEPAFTAITGEHDGYAPLVHRRWIVALKGLRVWLVADRVTGPPGHAVRSYVHWRHEAPIATFGAEVSAATGWYSERFGEKEQNRVTVLQGSSPAWMGYAIAAEPVSVVAEGERVVVSSAAGAVTVAFSVSGVVVS